MDENKIVNLQLEVKHINVILTGLGKLPLENSLQTFDVITNQVNTQIDDRPEGPLKDKVVQ